MFFLKKIGVVTTALALTAGSALLAISPAIAAPAGAFTGVVFEKVADGYDFTNNPVDTVNDNNTVGVKDYIGFTIQANTQAAVQDATMTLVKPACWVWAPETLTALNFNFDSGQSVGVVTQPDANTITVNWSQTPSGTVKTQVLRAQAGPNCADGSTWTPTLSITDASGSYTRQLSTVTVRSVASADITISNVGAPKNLNSRWFQDLGEVPAQQTLWKISLSPETIAKVGYSEPQNNRIRFNVTYSGPRSTFEVPNRTPYRSACWQFVGYNANPGGYSSANAPQTLTFEMSGDPSCAGILSQQNDIHIDTFTPLSYVEAAGCQATLTGTVTPNNWLDRSGNPIPDNPPTNNTASVPLTCFTPTYGSKPLHLLEAPTVEDAAYTAYPNQAFAPAGGWASVSGAGIGPDSRFMDVSGLDFEHPSLNGVTSHHFWDPKKQILDMDHLDAAVFGAGATNSSLTSVTYPA